MVVKDFESISKNERSEGPAFLRHLTTNDGRSIECLAVHPRVSQIYENFKLEKLKFPIWSVPMIVPPLPWISTKRGGFLTRPYEFTRLPKSDLKTGEIIEWEKRNDKAYPVFDSLNQLGESIFGKFTLHPIVVNIEVYTYWISR